MNRECIACHKQAQYTIRALQLRTLHVRAMTGEEKYQVPDDKVLEYGVCRECAQKRLKEHRTGKSGRKRTIIFAIIALAGVLLLFGAAQAGALTGQDQLVRVLRMVGLAAVLCGGAGFISTAKEAGAERKRLSGMSGEAALEECAWQVFLDSAPKEMGEEKWSLTYIPVNEKTLATLPGDLMILYDLQQGVAKEVMKKIGHPKA